MLDLHLGEFAVPATAANNIPHEAEFSFLYGQNNDLKPGDTVDLVAAFGMTAGSANVPGSTYYDSSQSSGKYIYAADGTQLQSAFTQLASDILRFTQ